MAHTFQKTQKLDNPLIITMSIIHTPRDEQPIIVIKLVNLWHAPSLFRNDKLLPRLDADGRVVLTAGP